MRDVVNKRFDKCKTERNALKRLPKHFTNPNYFSTAPIVLHSFGFWGFSLSLFFFFFRDGKQLILFVLVDIYIMYTDEYAAQIPTQFWILLTCSLGSAGLRNDLGIFAGACG